MSEPVDLKVPLDRRFDGGFHNYSLGPRPRPLLASLPLYLSRTGSRCHRVRRGMLHWQVWSGSWDGETRGLEVNRAHVSLRMWCHQTGIPGVKGRLLAVPPDGVPVCGTCEGRAVGAGWPGIAILRLKHDLIYAARSELGPGTAAREATA